MVIYFNDVENMFFSFVNLHELSEKIEGKTFVNFVGGVGLEDSESYLEGNFDNVGRGLLQEKHQL